MTKDAATERKEEISELESLRGIIEDFSLKGDRALEGDSVRLNYRDELLLSLKTLNEVSKRPPSQQHPAPLKL